MYLSRHQCPAPYQSMSDVSLTISHSDTGKKKGDNIEHTLDHMSA